MNTFIINNVNVKNVLYSALCESIEKKEDKIYISKQYYNIKKDTLPFNYFIFNDIDEIEQITKTNNNLYEILQHNKTVKPFLDVDLYLDENNKNIDENLLLKYVLDEFKKIYFDCFQIEIKNKDIVVLCGTTKKKISFHIIINNGYFFLNNTQQKEFIKYIHFKNIVLKNGIELKNIIDLSVYSKNKNFKLVNQSKLKKPINEDEEKIKKPKKIKEEGILKLISNHNIKDTLIINYFVEDPLILDCSFLNKQTEEIKKLNKEYKYNDIVYISNNKNNLNHVLSLIPTIYFSNYHDWRLIGTSIKNINYDYYDLFDFYSRGHKNYNEEENKIYYDSFKGNNSWGYLFSLINDEKINKLIKNQLKEDYKLYDSNENINNFKLIVDENKFINQQNLINATEKHIVLKAHPGKGKTQAIKEFIKYKSHNTEKNINEELEQLNIRIENKIKFIEIFKKMYEEYINEHDIIKSIEKHNNRLKQLNEEKEYIIKNNCCINKIKILILSSRITFAEHLSHVFKVKNYKVFEEEKENINKYEDSIIISVESLYKLNNNNVYDIIIIDEVESILNQFSSSTCKNKNDCYKNLCTFINNSKKIIYADAFVGERTFKFINFFDGEKLLIKNEVYENKKNAYIYNNEEELIIKLEDDLKKNKKIYVHFTSCKLGQNIINEIIYKKILKSDEIIYYSSTESIKEGEDTSNNKKLNNINEEWKKYKLICSTSSLTVGNSYENLDIDNIYIFGGINNFSGCCVRDSFQNHMRVRYNQGDLYVFIPPGKKTFKPDLLNYTENNQTKETELKNIQKYNFFKYSLEDNEIFYLLKNKKIKDNNFKIFLYGSIDYNILEEQYYKLNKEDAQEIIKKYNKLLKQYEIIINNYDNSLHEIIKINEFERHININLYKFIFVDYLKKMFYNIVHVRTTEKRFKTINTQPQYEDIININDEKLNEHIKKQNKNRITNKEINEINKAFFKKYFKDDKDDEIKQIIYNDIFSNQRKKEEFINIILEFNYYFNTTKFKNDLKNHIENIKHNQTEKSIKYIRLQEIIQLNKVLNIENSFNESIIDANTTIKNFQKYIKKEGKINTFKTLFKLNYNINNIDDFKYNRTFISNIYKNFNGSTLINEEVKKTKKTYNALSFRLATILLKNENQITGDDCKIKDYLKIYKSFEDFKTVENVDFID